MQAITKDFERLHKKQRVVGDAANKCLDSMIAELSAVRELVAGSSSEMDADSAAALKTTTEEIARKNTTVVADIASEQKELDNMLRKLSKLVDKALLADLSKVVGQTTLNTTLLNQILAQHLFREGRFELASVFLDEAGIQFPADMVDPFKRMHRILAAMAVRDVGPALLWAQENREALARKSSDLEFKLHQLHYLELLKSGDAQSALTYAKEMFADFAHTNMQEIRQLMTCLLFAKRLDKSPYAALVSDERWLRMSQHFMSEACSIVGLAFDSPLHLSMTAGARALPTLLKIMQVLSAKNKEWRPSDQIPVEIELGREFQYHSVFACPVSKEQTSGENPPMLLPCGHVIAKVSMGKLARGHARFKCPYCPTEQMTSQCRELHF